MVYFFNSFVFLILQDVMRLPFASGVKIRNGFLWILSSTFQNYITNRIDPYATNYRILAGSLALLTHDTSCHYLIDSYIHYGSTPVSSYNQTYWNTYDNRFIFYK